jgi:hypothetical protein
MVDLKRCWNPFCTNGVCDGMHHTGMAGERWTEPLNADNAPAAMKNGTRVLATVKCRTDTRCDWRIVNPALNMPHPDVLLPLASLTHWLTQESRPAGHYQLWSGEGLEVAGMWDGTLFMTVEDQDELDRDRADEEAAQAEQDRQIVLAEEQSDSMEYGLDA